VIERLSRASASVLVGVATAVVILALAIVPFINPAWVSFEQGRAGAEAATGYSPPQLRHATDAILSDLVLGPPKFDVVVAGHEVLNARERQHMSDVRGVFAGLAVLAALSVVVLVAAHRLFHGSARFWRAVRRGAAGLAAGVLVVGVVGAFAFDLTFDVFHRLFFAGGSYTFDPRTDRLVQIFPEQFWFETGLAVGAFILLLCLVASRLGSARGGAQATRPEAGAARLEPSR
jgi:integral membrane protein (TIGR01906 family)